MKVSELLQALKDFFKPYTFEDYVKEYEPEDNYELEQLEKQFSRITKHYLLAPRY